MADDPIESMKKGCVNDRVRLVFWNPWKQHFVALTPDFLLENGAPFDPDEQKYLEYNSTHLAQ